MADVIIVADDITGGNACGVRFTERGLRVFSLSSTFSKEDWNESDVIVCNTRTRECSPEEAFAKVHGVFSKVKEEEIKLLYKQSDSTMRGHVGLELAAALEGSGRKSMVFVPACPDHGRITKNGHHYVDDMPVDQASVSQLASYPPKSSSVIECIQQFVSASHVGIDIVEGPESRLIDELASQKDTGGVIVMDATRKEHLQKIYHAVEKVGFTLIGGAYEFAEVVADQFSKKNQQLSGCTKNNTEYKKIEGSTERSTCPALLAVGSLSNRTQTQINFVLKRKDFSLVVLNPDGWNLKERSNVVQQILARHKERKNVLLVPKRPSVDHGKAIKMQGQEVSQILGQVINQVLEYTMVKWSGLLLSGGETAGSIINELNSRGLTLLGEVFPTSPIGRLRDGPFDGTVVVLKAGDWGGEDALLQGVHHLQEKAPFL